MPSVLHRVSDRLTREVYAWLGTREKLELNVISYVKPETLELHLGTSTGVTEILPKSVAEGLIKAVQNGRNLSTIFVSDPKAPEHVAYVMTIDHAQRRVDRKLSSWQLLNDSWEMCGQELLRSEDVPTYDPDCSVRAHVGVLDFITAFAAIAADPISRRYERRFRKRQQDIANMFGQSRRFESLVACLGPQLDSETYTIFEQALRNLWTYEQWKSRKISFDDAKQSLSHAYLKIVLDDEDPIGWEMHDPGPVIGMYRWIDAEGDEIAYGSLYQEQIGARQQSVRLHVFGSFFDGEEAKELRLYFRDKDVFDRRTVREPQG